MEPTNENLSDEADLRSSADNARESATKKSRRGGARPGAGAPKGNLNGLKHGLRSKQLALVGKMFASNPKLQATLLALAERQGAKQKKADLIAARIFANILTRGLAIQNQGQADALRELLKGLSDST